MTRFEANVPRPLGTEPGNDHGKKNDEEPMTIKDRIAKIREESLKLRTEGRQMLEKSRRLTKKSNELESKMNSDTRK